jgi:hypothetical protein
MHVQVQCMKLSKKDICIEQDYIMRDMASMAASLQGRRALAVPDYLAHGTRLIDHGL